MATFFAGLNFGLLMAEMALTGRWGWIWWSAFVLGLAAIVLVAGHYYGPNDRSGSENAPPEGCGPSN